MQAELLERASRIHVDCLGNSKSPFQKAYDLIKTSNNLSDATLNSVKQIVEQAEQKNEVHLGYIKQLEEKYSFLQSIVKHPLFQTTEKTPGWLKSFNPVEAKLKAFQFDANGKYISGRLRKQDLDGLSTTALSKMWEQKLSQSSFSVSRNDILFGIPKWLQENASLIIADDEAKEKSERITELIAQIKLDENHDLSEVQKLSDELRKFINEGKKAAPPKKQKEKVSGGPGKCSECHKNTANLFGSSRSCGDCYEDGEFLEHAEKLQRKIDLWEQKPKDSEDKKIFRKFQELDYSEFQDAWAAFSEKHTLDNYNKMMALLKSCEKKVPITDDQLKPLRGETPSSSDDDDDDDEEEEEESSEEEPEYKPNSKKRHREEEDVDIEDVLETLAVATTEDKQNLLKKYKEDKSCLQQELQEIRKKRIVHYTFNIYFMMNGKKHPVPYGEKEKLFGSPQEAADCAQKWIGTLGEEEGSIYKYDIITK